MSLLLLLSEDLVGELLAFGSLGDVGRLAATHRSLAAAVRDNDYLWTQMLQRDWPGVAPAATPQTSEDEAEDHQQAEAKPSEDGSGGGNARDTYRSLAIKFGRTAHCYPRVSALWKRLEAWLLAHSDQLPPILSTLAPAAASIADMDALLQEAQARWNTLQVTTRREHRQKLAEEAAETDEAPRAIKRQKNEEDEEMEDDETGGDAFEASIGLPPRRKVFEVGADVREVDGMPLGELRLPDELLCSMLIHNGQADVMIREHLFTGLLGGFSFYSFHSNFRLMPLHDLLDATLDLAHADLQMKMTEEAVKRSKTRRRNSTGSIATGQQASAASAAVVPSSAESMAIAVSSDDVLSDFGLLHPLTSSPIGPEEVCFFLVGDGRVVRRMHDLTLHEVAPSLMAFLERHVTDLEAGHFACSPQRGLNRFPLVHETCSDTTTRGVRIHVSVLFVPEQSTRSQYFFTYRVRVMHDGTSSVRATLTTRHWEIENAHGQVEVVDGPGVVGEYPSVYPSCPVFTYESCCPLPTSSGRVKGWFTFMEDHSGETFHALIAPFTLDASKNYC